MTERGTDSGYLAFQYCRPDRLRIRRETHARHSDKPGDGFLHWVLRRLAAETGDLVLDAGCGPGIYHPFLQRRGARVVALDYSLGMVRAVLDSASERGMRIHACRARIESLPLTGGSCDRVMANHVLYHVPDIRRALLELRRVLKPGGRVVMATGASDYCRALQDLHDAAARKLGYEPARRFWRDSRLTIWSWSERCFRRSRSLNSRTPFDSPRRSPPFAITPPAWSTASTTRPTTAATARRSFPKWRSPYAR